MDGVAVVVSKRLPALTPTSQRAAIPHTKVSDCALTIAQRQNANAQRRDWFVSSTVSLAKPASCSKLDL